jgi:hypothetical protein
VSPRAAQGDALASEKKIAVVVFVMLVAAATAMVVAARARRLAPGSVTPVTSPGPQGTLSLGKEYIYGPGSRILATEDSGSGSSTPSITGINPDSAVPR